MQRPFYRKKRFYALIGFVSLMVFIYKFSEFRTSDRVYLKFFETSGYSSYGVDTVKFSGTKMRFVWAGESEKPLLLMVHGSPSSSSFWKGLFEDSMLRDEFKLIAVDRPGYGYSNFGKLNPDLNVQAELIARVIHKINSDQEVFILASSYGGSATARLAMNYPDLIDGVIFQSSSLIPGAERTYAFTHWTKGPFISKLLPTTIRLANEEKLGHSRELERIQSDWDKITAHTIFLHGTDDSLVYPDNAIIAHEKAINARSRDLVFFEGRGHDLYWTRRNELRDAIFGIKQKSMAYASALASNSENND
ncbi:MAG: alpha/beta hydrolase [Flavobacteriales bacterium]|nr:alpha/beta hydrolase [Flavobacteriales bacterium]